MISLLVLKLCFPQLEKMLFREKRVQSFENEKLKLISDYFQYAYHREKFKFCSKTFKSIFLRYFANNLWS